MGLLMSDTVLIDPMLDETLRDVPSARAYGLDVASDPHEYEAADLGD